jgi:hypothetical protein
MTAKLLGQLYPFPPEGGRPRCVDLAAVSGAACSGRSDVSPLGSVIAYRSFCRCPSDSFHAQRPFLTWTSYCLPRCLCSLDVEVLSRPDRDPLGTVDADACSSPYLAVDATRSLDLCSNFAALADYCVQEQSSRQRSSSDGTTRGFAKAFPVRVHSPVPVSSP